MWLGFAEDAATINTQPELNTLVSQKLFLEGIHFDLVYTPLKHLGYKLVVAAVSDIYAMNGEPRQLLLNVGVSSRFSLEDLEDLYDGVYTAANFYHSCIIVIFHSARKTSRNRD